MKNLGKVGISAAVAAALVACLGVSTALAGPEGNDTSGKDTMWEIPDKAMTNTIELDGTSYKVITTWANAWATGGPDYLGISNSCYLATAGGGTTTPTDLTEVQQETMLGVWASSANEVPNAYNWNCFFNLYANSDAGKAAGAVAADFQTTAAGFETESGVDGRFKYRPEIIYTSNGLAQTAVAEYVDYINNGDYYDGTADPGSGGYEPPADPSPYYVEGDETYDPIIISANNQNAYAYTDTFYNLADFVDEVIADNSAKAGTATDWKGMNTLPRATRYEAVGLTAQDCALNIERVTRGSVYYVLSQIAAGKAEKKKVAYITSSSSSGGGGGGGGGGRGDANEPTYLDMPDGDTVTVCAYDYIENIGQGPNNGYASFSPLVVDQLNTHVDETQNVIANESTVGANSSSYNNPAKGSALYATNSTATADDLLDCDYIYYPNGSLSSADIEEWLIENSTETEEVATQKAEKVGIIGSAPAIMQWSNFTAEKLMYGAYAVNFFYPELFPNFELVGYYYDEVWHLNTDSVAVAMSYGFGNADLPAGVSLADLAENYSKEDMEGKFNEGLEYFTENFQTDPTISRILAGQPLEDSITTETLSFNGSAGSSTYFESQIDAILADSAYTNAFVKYVGTLSDDDLAPFADMLLVVADRLAEDSTAQQDLIAQLQKELKEAQAAANKNSGSKGGSSLSKQTIKAKKSVKAKKGKKAKIKVTGAKTALKVTAKGKAKKALKIKVKKGKITVKAKKKGTYKIQVYAAASSKYAKSNTLKIKVKVK